MKKVIGYQYVYIESSIGNPVLTFLQEGWELFGAPLIYRDHLIQTMIKYEETDCG